MQHMLKQAMARNYEVDVVLLAKAPKIVHQEIASHWLPRRISAINSQNSCVYAVE